ncbi:GIY-YIG nuclease family protein [Rhizobium laguerreae]|uniref:GIY-YIG nuclease family protein n=1 Tax=Rhizobium laguerreae TaxID=1076926 RepID=UPI001C906F5F|nr:GIY-YIG nuclease family protein [Rhizobium laguerreae]MBY3245159.1 GIY-YIG nuclease family protein [Rhizobium laguerreae]
MTAGFIAFELDLMGAVLHQLVPQLNTMRGEPLTRAAAALLPEAQGVYLLIHQGKVHYVGKTDAQAGLRTRLTRHVAKFEQRDNIVPADVEFKAAQILVLTAMDIETQLISLYDADWNGSGFGSNDPGRERETTAKPPQGFDARFPINIDRSVEILTPGLTTVHRALMELKLALPFTLRYELEPGAKGSQAFRTRPHADLPAFPVTIPTGPMTIRQAVKILVAALPPGWQATYFASHLILYKETRSYVHGTPI